MHDVLNSDGRNEDRTVVSCAEEINMHIPLCGVDEHAWLEAVTVKRFSIRF